MQYLMLVAAALLLAVDFSVQKVYQKLKGTSPAAGFGFCALLGLFTVIVFFAANGCKTDFTWYSFIMAALVNSLVMCYNIIGFRLLKSGTVAVYTLFLMSGGMILPYVFGLLFLNEPFSVLKAVALVLILAGVVISDISREKVNTKQIIMCVAVFFLNGMVSVVSKLHQIENGFATVNATDFVLLGGAFKFIFAGLLYFSSRKCTKEKTENKKRLLPLFIILVSAVVSGASYLLQLWGAASLPATVLYPFITGGSIVASSLAGVVFFKEKLSKNLIAGIILCFVGMVMFL